MASPTFVVPQVSVCVDAPILHQQLNREIAQLRLKRAIDVAASIFALAFFAPFMGLIALAVWWSSTGPIIFRQARIGKDGQLFNFFKFRTMYVTAGVREADALAKEGILQKCSADPRVTPVGRFLRRFSLDELPQFYNVLRGDMSLVGPRPLIPFMLEKFPEFASARSLVKPGITGLWQIRARELNTSAAYMAPHDLEYIQNFSLRTDFRILASTFGAVLRGDGAV